MFQTEPFRKAEDHESAGEKKADSEGGEVNANELLRRVHPATRLENACT